MTTRSQPAAKHLTINGLRLRYLEWGRPDALPVICVHGYTSSAEAFNALARRLQDQEEPARGVLSERPDGRWAWKMDPAYIEQRVKRGAPARPPLWPTLETLPCATQIVWGTDSDVLSEAQAKRMVVALPRGELVGVPGVGHAPTLVEPPVLAALDRLLATV